jgi:hypothetical protein
MKKEKVDRLLVASALEGHLVDAARALSLAQARTMLQSLEAGDEVVLSMRRLRDGRHRFAWNVLAALSPKDEKQLRQVYEREKHLAHSRDLIREFKQRKPRIGRTRRPITK